MHGMSVDGFKRIFDRLMDEEIPMNQTGGTSLQYSCKFHPPGDKNKGHSCTTSGGSRPIGPVSVGIDGAVGIC